MRRIPPGAPILTAAGMRAVEQGAFDAGVSQDALMERAGQAIARETARLAAGRPVLVLAGPGNNGGDAYVAARVLAEAGVDVAVATLGVPKAGAAARMAALWLGPTTTLAEAQPRPVLLDGLLGIGVPRPFDAATQASVAALLAAAELRIAIDVPSGVDADTGAGGIAVDVTLALGALKPAHVMGEGAANAGHVLLDRIGLDVASRWATLATPRPTSRRHDLNKFTRGMVVVIAGEMPGAALLAATAALHGGAGYVVLAGLAPPAGPPHALVRRTLGTIADLSHLLADDRISTVVVGPGLGRGAEALALLDAVLDCPHDLVIDGDALSLLGRDIGARIAGRSGTVCLTPHAGEFARMFDPDDSKIAATLAAAQSSGAIVVHKGPDTVIAHPDGRAVVASSASPSLATAGTGDVLAGLVAARLSGSEAPADAVATAVWLHARAAALAGPGLIADDLVGHIAGALAECSPT